MKPFALFCIILGIILIIIAIASKRDSENKLSKSSKTLLAVGIPLIIAGIGFYIMFNKLY